MLKDTKVFTYETRISSSEKASLALDAFGKLYGVMERSLFQDILGKRSLNDLKSHYILCFGVTARHFNGCYKLLQGKIESIEQSRLLEMERCKEKVAALSKKVPKIKEAAVKHHKTRALNRVKERLKALEKEKEEGPISLCFGGRKLFYAQFHLEENGYASFEEWKQDWEAARSSEFFCIGSKDETAGNQSCVLIPQGEGFVAKLRLPDALAEYGKHVSFFLTFPDHGAQEIKKALAHHQALSYRFKKDKKGWRVFVSFERERAPTITSKSTGAIGIDINVNHIALTEIDAKGNPIDKKTYPLCCYGKTTDQSKALIGDVVKEIVQHAKEKQKPIVCERLDFKKKKVSLKEEIHWKARMLSSFHYSSFLECLDRKTFQEGVALYAVNPAMTSVIGKMKFAVRYGLSGHHGAALAIARRHFHFSEAPSQCIRVIHKCFHVTISLPAWNRQMHVWGRWRKASAKLKAALAALSRASPVPQKCASG